MAFKMKGNPAKMGMIKGTAGHSSAMKMKMEKDSAAKMKKEAAMKMKSPMEKELVGAQNNLPEELKAKIEASPAKQMDPKVEEAIRAFDRSTPAVTRKKPTKAQIKKILEKMKSIKGPGVQLSDDHKKTIEGVEKMIKENKSPAKQEGPTPEKNPDLMKGEMEGTATYEGKDNRERIVDLEDRAGFLTDNDIPDLEGSKDPKDIKRLNQLKATVKKLQNEADILRNRKPNKK